MAENNKPLLKRAGLVLLVVLIGTGAVFAGRWVVKKYVLDGGDIPEAPAEAAETVTFTDEKAGITLKYPADWRQIENNSTIDLSENESSEVRLIAGPEQDEPALKVRVRPLPAEINYDPDMSANDLGIIQGQLDKLIISPDVEVLERKAINDKGKLGFHYLYVLKQQATGREGVHSHYFIFDGAKLNVLVFEVFPRSEFEELAPTFDRIFESFTSERRDAPAGAPSVAPPAPAPAPVP